MNAHKKKQQWWSHTFKTNADQNHCRRVGQNKEKTWRTKEEHRINYAQHTHSHPHDRAANSAKWNQNRRTPKIQHLSCFRHLCVFSHLSSLSSLFSFCVPSSLPKIKHDSTLTNCRSKEKKKEYILVMLFKTLTKKMLKGVMIAQYIKNFRIVLAIHIFFPSVKKEMLFCVPERTKKSLCSPIIGAFFYASTHTNRLMDR